VVIQIKAGNFNTPPVSSCLIFLIKPLDKIKEVIDMVDLREKTIKDLFYTQVKKLTLNKMQSFDLQFSDAWI
jgi:hypothetical protein